MTSLFVAIQLCHSFRVKSFTSFGFWYLTCDSTMFTKSDCTPTPSDYHTDYQTDFEFPKQASTSQSSTFSLLDLHVQIDAENADTAAIPHWSYDKSCKSNQSYSAISVDDVDRLRQIIRNMKHKREDGVELTTTNSLNDLWLVCHTPNLSYNKYDSDEIYKYNSHQELQDATTHSTNNHSLYEPRWTPHAMRINQPIQPVQDDTTINISSTSMPWSYYKDITFKRNRNALLRTKPEGNYFIVAQLSHNVIEDTLQSSFNNHLDTLQKDESIRYDIRDIRSGKHLHHKSNGFGKQDSLHKYLAYTPGDDIGGMTPPRYYAPDDPDDSDSDNGITPRLPPALYDLRSNESNMSLFNIPSPMNQSLYALRSKSVLSSNSETGNDFPFSPTLTATQLYTHNGMKFKPTYRDDIQCIGYECMDEDGEDLEIINRNTAFIHDIIDPNKNINDHRLWIPSIFDGVTSKTDELVKSQIVGLDYVKYSELYGDIGYIFKRMQRMFENVLNRKLNAHEKVIVRCSKCVLQKYGDETQDVMHKEGMGENIECVGLFVPKIHGRKSIRLKLLVNDKYNKFIQNDINMSEGDCIVFSNECYHSMQRIVHNQYNADKKPIYYTILAFYVVNTKEMHMLTANTKSLYVNLVYNWSYIISFWLRLHCADSEYIITTISNSWMNGLIYLYLFGMDYDEYIYDRRQTMFMEKQKAVTKPDESFNIAHHLQSLLNEINIHQ
eukprot:174205_1